MMNFLQELIKSFLYVYLQSCSNKIPSREEWNSLKPSSFYKESDSSKSYTLYLIVKTFHCINSCRMPNA